MKFPRAAFIAFGAALIPGCTAPPPELDGLQPINGTELYVKTMGRGEPIVIVHGGPGWDHSYFLPQMAELAEDHRLVFYDQRVSGRSSPDVEPEEVTLDRFMGDIEGVRELLGVERMHLLGHSFGGMLAMQYAIRHPDRLESLMLIDTTAASDEYMARANQVLEQRFSPDARARRAELVQSDAFRRRDPDAILEFLKILLSSNFHDPEKVEQLNLYIPPDFGVRSTKLAALSGDLTGYDIHERLGEISCPTLIVRGDSEALPEEATDRIHAAIAGSRVEVLEDCGHFPFVECNDRLQRVLREFLSGL